MLGDQKWWEGSDIGFFEMRSPIRMCCPWLHYLRSLHSLFENQRKRVYVDMDMFDPGMGKLQMGDGLER